jgi:hypothetical protein
MKIEKEKLETGLSVRTYKMKVDTHKSVGVYFLMYTERGG